MKNKHYQFKDLFNVRDIGGYITSSGQIVREHKIIRGTGMGTLTREEFQQLKDDGIHTIIDLRNPDEVLKHGHPCLTYPGMVCYHVDIIGSFENMHAKNYSELTELYIDIVNDSKDKIRELFKLISEHITNGLYINCTAGKDRTGITIAFILKLCGVRDKEIIDNYAESYENNLPRYKDVDHSGKMAVYFYSEPQYLVKLFAYIKSKYGSVKEYLLSVGVTQQEINHIVKTLVK